MKLFINGTDELIEKDIFGRIIQYNKCLHVKSDRHFLNIQSKAQHLFGKYTLWNSDDGDILSVVREEGSIIYKFEKDRFWLYKDEVLINQIESEFMGLYPSAHVPEYRNGNIVAIFHDIIRTYEVLESNKTGRFVFNLINEDTFISDYEVEEGCMPEPEPIEAKASKKQAKVDIVVENLNRAFAEEDSENEDELSCKLKKCFYNENNLCKYFDMQINNEATKETICNEPIIYLENK